MLKIKWQLKAGTVFLSPFKQDRAEKPRPKNSQTNNKGQTNMISKQDRVNYWGTGTVAIISMDESWGNGSSAGTILVGVAAQ